MRVPSELIANFWGALPEVPTGTVVSTVPVEVTGPREQVHKICTRVVGPPL
jgi:hypothetical protein